MPLQIDVDEIKPTVFLRQASLRAIHSKVSFHCRPPGHRSGRSNTTGTVAESFFEAATFSSFSSATQSKPDKKP